MYLGRSLPSLLDEGCDLSTKDFSNSVWFPFDLPFVRRFVKKESLPATINHHSGRQWQSWTLLELRRAAEEVGLSLHQRSTVEKGDRVVLWMASSVPFVMADIGCLLAQLVTVPMPPEQPLETSEYMLKETSASVLFVSRLAQIKPLLPKLPALPDLRLIVVTDETQASSKHSSDHPLQNRLASLQSSLPETVELITLESLRQQAKWSAAEVAQLRTALHPQDLATIVYTLSASGRPLGAMLTHENLSGSALAAFGTLPCLRKGSSEVALSFLPLHHIFARVFVYGSLSYGQSLYFSSPRRVMTHLREIKPTVFFAVPRLLEKVYEGWQATLQSDSAPTQKNSRRALLKRPRQQVLSWAWRVAERYRLDDQQSIGYRAQLWVARLTVLRSLRNLFGGRLQCFIVGGAALPAEVMTLFAAAGLKLAQGYGLTEAGSTLSFTRRQWSRAGTVGVPMPGVSLALAPDGEVMAKAPYVMQGYYRNPEATQAVLEENGWLHTGDRGEFSADGLLTLTGQKKALFKLSIGEYVAPGPIEQKLCESPLVQQALVVGPGRKFCGLLIFPEEAALAIQARHMGIAAAAEPLIDQPEVLAMYQSLVDQANAALPLWSTVKRFQLVNASKKSLHQLSREALYSAFADEIDQLYQPLVSKPSSAPITVKAPAVPTAISQPSTLTESTT